MGNYIEYIGVITRANVDEIYLDVGLGGLTRVIWGEEEWVRGTSSHLGTASSGLLWNTRINM